MFDPIVLIGKKYKVPVYKQQVVREAVGELVKPWIPTLKKLAKK